jgi:hypothetical protein
MSQAISSVEPSWRTTPFTSVRIDLCSKSQSVNDPRSKGAQGVGALHPQHRPGVGVAKVVEPEVVRDRVARDVVRRLGELDIACRSTDDDGNLALVVEIMAVRGSHHGAAVGVDR